MTTTSTPAGPTTSNPSSNALAIAFDGFLAPLFATKGFRRLLFALVVILVGLIVLYYVGWIDRKDLTEIRHLFILPGLPIGAALLGEMALRDGITQRTLLYVLMGPVSRPWLAAVRTVATGFLLATGVATGLIVLHALRGRSWDQLPLELVATLLGALAYTSLFGVVHLITRRGLVTCLALYGVFDQVLGRLPFSLRLLAPSYHLGVLTDVQDTFNLPVSVSAASSSEWASAFALVAITVAGVAAAALLFSRKPLGELC